MQTKESIMRHALGVTERRAVPFRNHYAYDPASSTGVIIRELINAGLMVPGKAGSIGKGDRLNNAHVTMTGLVSLNITALSHLPHTVQINGALVPVFDE